MAIIPSFIPGGQELQSAITNFLEGGVAGMESVRSINYGTTYLWTLDFIDTNGLTLPAPFDRFFPAADITLNLGVSNSQVFEAGQTQIPFPVNTGFKTLDITFYDDINRSLQRWMADWINVDIQNAGQFMSGVLDSHTSVVPDSFGQTRPVQPLRHVKIALLNGYREDALVYNYNIIPDGPIIFLGSQASEATQFQMRFNIYEELARPKPEQADVFSNVKRIIGQTVGRFV